MQPGLSGLAGGRPGSRGGPLMGMGRPGTGARLGTGFGKPPGTGMGGMMPPGTGMGGPQILDRPVTQQGMQGRPTTGMNTGRMIQDGSYWVGKVQEKMSELNQESARLQGEGEQMQKDYNSFVVCETKKANFEKDLSKNETMLAEYNLVIEKLHAGATAADINAESEELATRNSVLNKEIGTLFEARTEVERHLSQEQSRVQSHQQEVQNLINQLPAERANLYFQLKESNENCAKEKAARVIELEHLSQSVADKERELAGDPQKQQAIKMNEEHRRLQDQMRELEEDLHMRESKDPRELTAELRAKVQQENRDMEALTNVISEVENKIEELDARLERRNADLKESASTSSGNDKMEELQKKEKELQDFLAAFEGKRDAQEQQMKLKEGMVVQLLAQISRASESSVNMPSPAKLNEMVTDLKYKEQQRNLSQNTQKMLNADMEKKKAELDKINTLDKKIGIELSQMQEKMATWSAELNKFSNPEAMRQENNHIMKELHIKREKLSRYKAFGKDMVQDVMTRNNQKEKIIKENAVGQELQAAEKRMATINGQVYRSKDFIASKTRASNYVALKEDCLKNITELNGHVTNSVHMQALTKQSSTSY